MKRIALVTGTNRGIGLEIARGLARRGDVHVVAASRREEDALSTAEQVGHGAVGVHLDLVDPARAETHVRAIDSAHGPVDILVNNAGIPGSEEGLQTEVVTLSMVLAVNTVAPFALIRALAPGMLARRWGRIVNVSSRWGSFASGLTGPVAYSVSKAALNAMTVSVARDLAPHVKVNAASPGWVRTRMGGTGADRSPEEGADTPIWLATLPDEGPTGGFFHDREPAPW